MLVVLLLRGFDPRQLGAQRSTVRLEPGARTRENEDVASLCFTAPSHRRQSPSLAAPNDVRFQRLEGEAGLRGVAHQPQYPSLSQQALGMRLVRRQGLTRSVVVERGTQH